MFPKSMTTIVGQELKKFIQKKFFILYIDHACSYKN